MEEKGKTKYAALMENLKGDILSGKIKPGEKLPSENELSARYEISRHTVRKALGILANEGYITAEHGRGTFCSERMRHTKNSRNIAVITTYLSDYIFPRVLQGVDQVLTENGYSIILKNTGNSRAKEVRCLEDILTKDIDGLIIEPSKSQMYCKHQHLYERLDEYGIPYVFIQGIFPQMEHKPYVLMDDCQGGYLLTKYLIGLGHKRIAGIFKVDDIQGQDRHKGYVRALQEAGMTYNPDMVIWFHTEDRTVKPISEITRMVKAGVDIDAVVCYNDQIAMEAIRVLKIAGKRVPEDLSVTGYDNSAIAQSGHVKLTTIAHPQEKLGRMAAELLLSCIRGGEMTEEERHLRIAPELIVRESCRDRKTTCKDERTSPRIKVSQDTN